MACFCLVVASAWGVGLGIAVPQAPAQAEPDSLLITEWMYSGVDGEFVELTNVGEEPVDTAGWSYDDDSATPGGFDLSGFGEVAPGESVVFTEAGAEQFRADWGVCGEAKVLGGVTNNLGRNDQINIFDAEGELVDRLTYGDGDFPGSIRTQEVSGWVSEAGLGADDVTAWTLSAVDDAEGSTTSANGDIGSPGKSTHGGFDTCGGGGVDPEDVQVSVGDSVNCALVAEEAYCWGRGHDGQMGNGQTESRNELPVAVDLSGLADGERMVSVKAGGGHVCGLTDVGTVYCWGSRRDGAIGNGGPAGAGDLATTPTAVDMSPLEGETFTSLTLQRLSTSCGVTSGGRLFCWGRGPDGESRLAPTEVDLTGLGEDAFVTAFSVQPTSLPETGIGCGLLDDGAAFCFDSEGKPFLVPTGLRFDTLAVGPGGFLGSGFACGLVADGAAYCWGDGEGGQLGNGSTASSPIPVPVSMESVTGDGFVEIDSGGSGTCAVADDGSAYCWGTGFLGNGPEIVTTGTSTSLVPVAVDATRLPEGDGFATVSVFQNQQACATTTGAEIYCWGQDRGGALGNGPVLSHITNIPGRVRFDAVGEPPSISVGQVPPGAVGDPSNPTSTLTLADPDTDLADLTIDVSVDNEAVITSEGITITGDGAERTLSLEPVGRGTTPIRFVVTDPDGNQAVATLQYAASAQAPDPSGRYHHRISDASDALDVGDGHMLLVNDETNTIFLHRQETTGLPVKTWNFTSAQLGTNDEIDFESIARSGDLLVLSGSHGNNRNGKVRTERRTFVAATITGSGADTEVSFRGRYNGLWSELRTWDQTDGHGLGADALGFIAGTGSGDEPNPPNGFNIEAAELSPDGEALYIGFRAPTVDVDGARHALIVPLVNVEDTSEGAPALGPAEFGDPILLDLDGRSIRALRANEHGEYLISAGPSPQNDSWALYTWDGDPGSEPAFNRELPEPDPLTGGTWESIVAVPHPLSEGAAVRMVADSGDTNFYGTGQTKDLAQSFQKSYSQELALETVELDPIVNDEVPAISGEPVVGETLSGSAGEWTPTPDSVSYQWLADGEPIEGATESTYLLTEAELGGEISVEVTASAEGFEDATAVSDVAERVAAPEPVCSGRTGEEWVDAGFNVIEGTEDGDDLVGTARPDVIYGLAGDDAIRGLAGDDIVCGGEGDDVIVGGGGDDELAGQGGRDVLEGGGGADVLEGGDGADELQGGGGADTLVGGGGADRLVGQGGRDVLMGGGGADVLVGGGGADVLIGGDGADELDGGGGRDELDGGAGRDVCDGGGGRDTANGCEVRLR